MTTKITKDNIVPNTFSSISTPLITSVQITDSNYNNVNVTAANVQGQGTYIVINGDGFSTNPVLLVDTIPITNFTRVSSTLIQAQLPVYSSGTYLVQVINPDGSTAILINGITYSSFPAWTTGSSIYSIEAKAPVNIQLSANDGEGSSIVYTLATGSTLPAGLQLYSNGSIQGAVSTNGNVTYNFTVIATDTQSQDTRRSFSLPVTLNTPPTWAYQTGSLPSASQLTYYSNTVVATDPDISSYIVTSGSLPPGLKLDVDTGTIAGITASQNYGNTYSFVITATDTAGFSTPKNFNISISNVTSKVVSTLIRTTGVNNANNSIFIDSGPYANTITTKGNPIQGTFTPYSQSANNWSALWGTSYGSYTMPAINAGNSDITTEFWLNWQGKPTFTNSSGTVAYLHATGSKASFDTYSSVVINGQTNPPTILFTYGEPGLSGNAATISAPISPGVWNHYLCTRSKDNANLWINGVETGTLTSSLNNLTVGMANTQYFNEAANDFLYASALQAYISNFRIITNQALVRGNFTPSTTGLLPNTPGHTGPNVASSITGTVQELLFSTPQWNKDRSLNNRQFTQSYAPQSVAASPYSPFETTRRYGNASIGGSAFFNGTNDYLRIPSNSNYTIGANDFTVEAWIFVTGGAGTEREIVCRHQPSTAINWQLELTAGNLLSFYYQGVSAGESIDSDTTVPLYQWIHVAGGISGTNKFVCINGVYKSTAYSQQPATTGTGTTLDLTIGATVSPNFYFTGYITDVRIVKGTAVYTANYNPPKDPLTSIPNTVFLANFTNSNIYDESGNNNYNAVGNVKTSTQVTNYETSSIFFDGSSTYLISASSNKAHTFDVSQPFTIEGWFYSINTSGTRSLFTLGDEAPYRYTVFLNNAALGVNMYGGSSTQMGGAVLPNTWNHIAITITASSNVRGFINGTLLANTQTQAGLIGNTVIRIGSDGSGQANWFGYMEGFRITKGASLYNTSFIPPTLSLPF